MCGAADSLKPSVPFRVRPMLATLVNERCGKDGKARGPALVGSLTYFFTAEMLTSPRNYRSTLARFVCRRFQPFDVQAAGCSIYCLLTCDPAPVMLPFTRSV